MSRRRTRRGGQLSGESHFVQMIEWLAMEAEAERERLEQRIRDQASANAEASGETLLNLVIRDHRPVLGDRVELRLERKTAGAPLPWHRLRPGAPVILSSWPAGSTRFLSGVVSGRGDSHLSVTVADWPEFDRIRVDAANDETTMRRQREALDAVRRSRGRVGRHRDVAMGERTPEFFDVATPSFQSDLNESQRSAVQFALSSGDLAIIHGPPGTGKTTTVAELIYQIAERGESVLATAPSNTAVDNLVERLLKLGVPLVRLGHPARVARHLHDYTLDGQVQQHENAEVIEALIREADQLDRKAGKYTRAKPPKGAKAEMRREARMLIREARALERQAIRHVLERAPVICSTLAVPFDLLDDRWFDWAIVDEACQATEPATWVPMLRADRVVLAGDPFQLPPTILSVPAAEQGFSVSLLERLMQVHGASVTRMLTTQYRMHRDIMNFSSTEFYAGQLQADPSVETHQLAEIQTLEPVELFAGPTTFVDTAGAGWEEEVEPDGESRFNRCEAEWVARVVEKLLSGGCTSDQIAVIAPYAAQVRLLRELCPEPSVEIDTVDGFQGREKDIVIITLVRSNAEGEVGFLQEIRRTNVAMTRARKKLIMIGDGATLSGHPFYQRLLEHFQSRDAWKSLWTLPGDLGP